MAEDPKPVVAMTDVAKPGTTPASASSKPVIVGHTTVVTDPMVSKLPDTPTPAAAPTPPTPVVTTATAGSMKQRITPTSDSQKVQAEAAKEDDESHAEADPIKKEEEPDKQVRLGELIESGEYNVSIKQKKASSNAATFLGTLLGIVLLAGIAVYLLADLKVIDIGVKLPFEIFK